MSTVVELCLQRHRFALNRQTTSHNANCKSHAESDAPKLCQYRQHQ